MIVQTRNLMNWVPWNTMPKLSLFLFFYSCVIQLFQALLIFPELAILYGACAESNNRFLYLLVISNFVFNLAPYTSCYGPVEYDTYQSACKICDHMSFIIRLLAFFVYLFWYFLILYLIHCYLS